MQTVARKNWVPQRCSYVHSGKRCGRKRCLSFLSPDWLTKAVVSSRLVPGFRWRWWRRRRLRSSSSPCHSSQRASSRFRFWVTEKVYEDLKLVFGCLTGIQTRSEIRTMSGANLPPWQCAHHQRNKVFAPFPLWALLHTRVYYYLQTAFYLPHATPKFILFITWY